MKVHKDPFVQYIIHHDFIIQAVKNFISVTLSIKDKTRLVEEDKIIISDFEATFSTRNTYIEFKTGGQAAMRKALQKIKDSPNRKTVLLVGLETPPRRR